MKTTKWLVELLVPEKLQDVKERTMRTKGNKLTENQVVELKNLAELEDEEINVEEIPEMSDWSGAERGVFYRPVKQQTSSRSDQT